MDERWIWAAIALGGGIIVGALAGALVRRLLASERRRRETREIARAAGIFVFWMATATGALLAVAATSPTTLEPLPRDLLDWVPNALVGGLFLLGGYALGLTLAGAIGRALARASGQRPRSLERAVRTVVMSGALILALAQLGVDTTILNILIAAVAFGAAGAAAGVAVVGGRDVARHVAAGRALRPHLHQGTRITTNSWTGVVSERTTTHVEIQSDDGRRILVPNRFLLNAQLVLDQPE